MAINFPASPSVNETFTEGSITYKCLQNNPTKWIGLGVTPADRLVEGSNNLEINSSNNLIWTGGSVGIGTSSPAFPSGSGIEITSTQVQVCISGLYSYYKPKLIKKLDYVKS